MIITQLPSARGPLGQLAGQVLRRACALLAGRRCEDDSRPGRMAAPLSAVTSLFLLREFLQAPTAELTQTAAGLLRRRQQACGGWADLAGGVPEVAVSVQAYVVLRLAGDPPDAYHMARAAGWIRDAGGPAAAGHATMTWLALTGLGLWQRPAWRLPAWWLPAWWLGPHGWRRHNVTTAAIPLAVIASVRPVRRPVFDVSELQPPGQAASHSGRTERPGAPRPAGRTGRGRRSWQRNVVALQVLAGLRAVAVRRCAAMIIASQDQGGSWGQAAQRSAFSLAALRIAGCSRRHPAMSRGLAWLDQFATTDPAADVPAAGRSARGFQASDPAGQHRPSGAIGRCLSDVR